MSDEWNELPLPDLDDGWRAGQRLPARGAATWCVRASAFRDPVGDAERVAAVLGIDAVSAMRLVASAPVVLAEGSTRDEAERIGDALRALGARVAVEDVAAVGPGGPSSSVAPSSLSPGSHPPGPSRAGSGAAPSMSPSMSPSFDASSSVEEGPERTFWMEVPTSFLAPVLGRGSVVLVGVGVLGAGSSFLLRFGGIFSMLMGLAGIFLAIGLTTELFAKLAQAVTGREPGELPRPSISMPDASTLTLRGLFSGIVLGSFAFLLAVVLRTFGGAATVVVAFVLYAYWPMALTVQGITGRLVRVFDAISVVRAVMAAPLQYGVVVVASFVLVAGSTFAVTVAAVALSESFFLGVGVAFCLFAALAYTHGVLGYLMGAIVHTKQESFAFLVED